jgi:hypothetical protein
MQNYVLKEEVKKFKYVFQKAENRECPGVHKINVAL